MWEQKQRSAAEPCGLDGGRIRRCLCVPAPSPLPLVSDEGALR